MTSYTMDKSPYINETALPYDPYLTYPHTEEGQRPTQKTRTTLLAKTGFLEGLQNSYGAVSWILGFREKYSLVFCAWRWYLRRKHGS